MGIWSRLFGTKTEVRAFDPWAFDPRYLFPTKPNKYWLYSNFDVVLTNLAVAVRAIALRSEILASVPLILYRRSADGGRERADDNPLFQVLHDIANPNQSAFEFREFMVRSLDLHGNAYARIERNARGQVTALWPYLFGDVQVEQLDTGRLRYRVYNGRRVEVQLGEDMLHIRGPSRDGILGQSPIMIARGALSLALAHQETAQSLSSNSLRPSGLLTYPQALSQTQRDAVKEAAASNYGGESNAGKLMVADGGAKYETISFSPEDAQFLESRKLANEDVARIFGMPPTSVGITDKATYSNTEQEGRALVQNAIGPLAARIETAMQRCLLTEAGRRTLLIAHDLDGLLRGDIKSRFEAYRLGRECGVYSPNDIRTKENEPPIGAEGDVYHMPANWLPLGAAVPQQQQGGPTP
jgi:HK97 family phage portal protein